MNLAPSPNRVTTGIVNSTVPGFMVVDHDSGFTVLELIEDDVGILPGEAIGAVWDGGYGGGSIFQRGVEHEVFFHGRQVALSDAINTMHLIARPIR